MASSLWYKASVIQETGTNHSRDTPIYNCESLVTNFSGYCYFLEIFGTDYVAWKISQGSQSVLASLIFDTLTGIPYKLRCSQKFFCSYKNLPKGCWTWYFGIHFTLWGWSTKIWNKLPRFTKMQNFLKFDNKHDF